MSERWQQSKLARVLLIAISVKLIKMVLDNTLEKNEDTLVMLEDSLPQASVDRFVYGLQQRKWKEWDIIQFTASVRNSHTYAIMENGRLRDWKDTFNEEYATDHNTYFTTAERSMNRIRCTLSGIKKAVTKLCYTSKKQLPSDADTPTVYERSPLLNGQYSPDLFGLDAYGKSVKMLYDELVNYLNTASENVELCLEVIERENYMRQHPEEIIEVHDKCYQTTFNHSQCIIKRFLNAGVNVDNDILNAIEDADDAQEMIAELFHMLNVNQWNDYVVCRATAEAQNIGLTKEELFLWGRERKEQVMRVRKLLAHLDELEMKKVKKGCALSGYFLMRLFGWCDINDNRQHAVLRDYIAHNYKGIVVKIGAVNAEKRKCLMLDNSENKRQQEDFNKTIDDFLNRF